MPDGDRLKRNQERLTSKTKGIYPPASHTHYSFDNKLGITGDLSVVGDASISGDLDVDDNLGVGGDLEVTGDAEINGELTVNSKSVSTLDIDDVLVYENSVLCHENKILVWES